MPPALGIGIWQSKWHGHCVVGGESKRHGHCVVGGQSKRNRFAVFMMLNTVLLPMMSISTLQHFVDDLHHNKVHNK